MSTSGIKGLFAYLVSVVASVFTHDVISLIYQLLGCVCVVYSIINFAASAKAKKAETSKHAAAERAEILHARLTELKIQRMENETNESGSIH